MRQYRAEKAVRNCSLGKLDKAKFESGCESSRSFWYVEKSSAQFLDAQYGIAVGAVCIFCYQRNGCGYAVEIEYCSAREGLLICCGGKGNRGAGSGNHIAVEFQMQGSGEGGACAGSDNGIVFNFINPVFGQHKFCCAGGMGDCRACLCLRGGEGEGIACGGRGLRRCIGGAVQI